MRSWTNSFVSVNIFCLPGKQKNVNIIPKTQISMDLSYIDPSLRVLDYFSK